jgi:hypothetical protein
MHIATRNMLIAIFFCNKRIVLKLSHLEEKNLYCIAICILHVTICILQLKYCSMHIARKKLETSSPNEQTWSNTFTAPLVSETDQNRNEYAYWDTQYAYCEKTFAIYFCNMSSMKMTRLNQRTNCASRFTITSLAGLLSPPKCNNFFWVDTSVKPHSVLTKSPNGFFDSILSIHR